MYCQYCHIFVTRVYVVRSAQPIPFSLDFVNYDFTMYIITVRRVVLTVVGAL